MWFSGKSPGLRVSHKSLGSSLNPFTSCVTSGINTLPIWSSVFICIMRITRTPFRVKWDHECIRWPDRTGIHLAVRKAACPLYREANPQGASDLPALRGRIGQRRFLREAKLDLGLGEEELLALTLRGTKPQPEHSLSFCQPLPNAYLCQALCWAMQLQTWIKLLRELEVWERDRQVPDTCNTAGQCGKPRSGP